LQRNSKYKNFNIITFVFNNFRFKNILTNINKSSASVVAFNKRLEISKNYNKHINFKTQNMQQQQSLVVVIKVLKVVLFNIVKILSLI